MVNDLRQRKERFARRVLEEAMRTTSVERQARMISFKSLAANTLLLCYAVILITAPSVPLVPSPISEVESNIFLSEDPRLSC